MAIPFEFIPEFSERIALLSDRFYGEADKLNLGTTAGITALAALILPTYDRVIKEPAAPKTDFERKLNEQFRNTIANNELRFGSEFDAHYEISRIERTEWEPILKVITEASSTKITFGDALSNIRNAIAHGHVFYLNKNKLLIEGDETYGVAFVRNNKKYSYVSILEDSSIRSLVEKYSIFLKESKWA